MFFLNLSKWVQVTKINISKQIIKTLSICDKRMISFVLVFAVFLTSCVFQAGNSGNNVKMVMSPQYSVEVTIISILEDSNEDCLQKCPGYKYPLDKATVKIDKILSSSNPDRVGGEGLQEGKEITVNFIYSARPAKIIYQQPSTGQKNDSPENTVSSIPLFAEPIPKEGGYFIYKVKASGEKQSGVVLPGLKQGYTIRTVISLETPTKGSISDYEIIQ